MSSLIHSCYDELRDSTLSSVKVSGSEWKTDYRRFKEQMWDMIAAEMGMPWRAIEAMHWQMGEHEIAHRANAPVFQLSSASSTPTIARSPTTPHAIPVQPVTVARSNLLTESHIHGHGRTHSQTAGFVSDSIIQPHHNAIPPRHERGHSRSHSQSNSHSNHVLADTHDPNAPRSRRNSSTSSMNRRARANSNSVPPPPLRQHQLTPVSEGENGPHNSSRPPANAVQIAHNHHHAAPHSAPSTRGTNPGWAVGMKPVSRTGTPDSLSTSGVAADREDED